MLFKTFLSLLSLSLISISAMAATSVEFLPGNSAKLTDAEIRFKLEASIRSQIDISKFQTVRAKMVAYEGSQALVVYLHSKLFHRVDFVLLKLRSDLSVAKTERDFNPASLSTSSLTANCPDVSAQFIVFAPNNRKVELSSADEVGDAAEAMGLKTVRLLKSDATKEAYVNYMSCPNLIGNFYDGDANKGLITTADGDLTSAEIDSSLKGALRGKVTNIWVACDAYNDPMLSTMINTIQSQKYASGKNSLLVAPSDKVAVCAMKAALQHQPLAESFEACRQKLDAKWWNKWGFGGNGSNLFGE